MTNHNEINTKKKSSDLKDVAKGGIVGGGLTGTGIVAANAVGYSAITHSSGAAIMTFGGKMVAGTIGTVSAGILAAPVTVIAGACAVGGLGYLAFKKLRPPVESSSKEDS